MKVAILADRSGRVLSSNSPDRRQWITAYYAVRNRDMAAEPAIPIMRI